MGAPFTLSVQNRPGESILAQSPTTFLRVSETSDRQHIQPGEHCRGSQAYGSQ